MGKELVFETSGYITLSPKITTLLDKVVKLLGAQRFYIRDGNKIVVVI